MLIIASGRLTCWDLLSFLKELKETDAGTHVSVEVLDPSNPNDVSLTTMYDECVDIMQASLKDGHLKEWGNHFKFLEVEAG